MSPGVKAVCRGKNVLVFKEMLKDIGYQDLGVADLLVTGVKTVGEIPKTGLWKPKVTPAICSIKTLWERAKATQKALLTPRPASGMDSEIWEKTLQDVGNEALVGPLSVGDVVKAAGSLWVGAFRFGIRQSGKVRAIDDFSQFLQNMTVGKCEKVHLLSVDDVVARARLWGELTANKGGAVLDTSGKRSTLVIHPSWNLTDLELKGRLVDLKSAYKQLPLHPAHSAVGIIAVKKQGGSKELFRTRSALRCTP